MRYARCNRRIQLVKNGIALIIGAKVVGKLGRRISLIVGAVIGLCIAFVSASLAFMFYFSPPGVAVNKMGGYLVVKNRFMEYSLAVDELKIVDLASDRVIMRVISRQSSFGWPMSHVFYLEAGTVEENMMRNKEWHLLVESQSLNLLSSGEEYRLLLRGNNGFATSTWGDVVVRIP